MPKVNDNVNTTVSKITQTIFGSLGTKMIAGAALIFAGWAASLVAQAKEKTQLEVVAPVVSDTAAALRCEFRRQDSLQKSEIIQTLVYLTNRNERAMAKAIEGYAEALESVDKADSLQRARQQRELEKTKRLVDRAVNR